MNICLNSEKDCILLVNAMFCVYVCAWAGKSRAFGLFIQSK